MIFRGNVKWGRGLEEAQDGRLMEGGSFKNMIGCYLRYPIDF